MKPDILKARACYYEFLAFPFFFNENGDLFKKWQEQCIYLSKIPLDEKNIEDFNFLLSCKFENFLDEQNAVLYDFSYVNVPLNASMYDEGRDEGQMRIKMIDIIHKSAYRRNKENHQDSEDFIGFIFNLTSTFLLDEANQKAQNLSFETFNEIINEFIDEFIFRLSSHNASKIYKHIANILEVFINNERAFLGVEKPKEKISKIDLAFNRVPYQTKLPTPKSKLNISEIGNL